MTNPRKRNNLIELKREVKKAHYRDERDSLHGQEEGKSGAKHGNNQTNQQTGSIQLEGDMMDWIEEITKELC